jgi:hypothetical protein
LQTAVRDATLACASLLMLQLFTYVEHINKTHNCSAVMPRQHGTALEDISLVQRNAAIHECTRVIKPVRRCVFEFAAKNVMKETNKCRQTLIAS